MLAVILSHFNPAGFSTLRNNYLRTLAECRLHLPEGCVFNGELVYGDAATVDPQAIRIQAHEGNQWLWQKERIFHIVAESLPERFDKFAFIDADLIFTNPHWYDELTWMLDSYDIVQPWKYCHWTDENHHSIKTRQSVPAVGRFPAWDLCHPGFAWAFRRDAFNKTGWFTYGLNGSGDSMLAWALFNEGDKPYFALQTKDQTVYNDYRQKFTELPEAPRVGFLRGEVIHRWHGSYEDRQYRTRNADLLAAGFEYDCVRVGENGLLEWTEAAPSEVVNQMRYFFFRRYEDGR